MTTLMRTPQDLIRADSLARREPTAVETFARRHADLEHAGRARYRDLIPASKPGTGQQYTFEVDLDRCTGCKACVTACHNLNGLDSDETWRSVGLLTGGAGENAFQQHVTTACHHCVDPACSNGCPVKAYEKDPATGIVRHLDDQCIGCKYCMFKCPYDVPQYNRSKGIVRKCDMCSTRLAAGEAPACVQACPTQAIRITVVDQAAAVRSGEAGAMVPGAPPSDYTVPTTTYRSGGTMPRDLLPADYYTVRPQHAHMPLIVMLVLTQLSVGTFCADLWTTTFAPAAVTNLLQPAHALLALCAGLLALGASVFHLGRPRYAFRAMLGVRTSWLSREIAAFGIFAALAKVYAGAVWAPHSDAIFPVPIHRFLQALPVSWLGSAVVVTGVLGVVCSIMIYADCHRELWRAPHTAVRFVGTAALLGTAVILALSIYQAAGSSWIDPVDIMEVYGRKICAVLAAVSAIKLSWEAAIFRHLRRPVHSLLKSSALLMSGDLRTVTTTRFVAGLAGGVVVPLALAMAPRLHSELLLPAVTTILLSVLLGEFCERILYFRGVVTRRMPGNVA